MNDRHKVLINKSMFCIRVTFLVWIFTSGLMNNAKAEVAVLTDCSNLEWRQLINDGVVKIETQKGYNPDLSCFRFSQRGELIEIPVVAPGIALKVLEKKWRLRYEGKLGEARISINLNRLNLTSSDIKQLSLLIDDDNDFSNGYQKNLPVSMIREGMAIFNKVDFGKSVYFTISTKLISLKFIKQPSNTDSDHDIGKEVEVSTINDLESLLPIPEMNISVGLIKTTANGDEVLVESKNIKTIGGVVNFEGFNLYKAGKGYRFYAEISGLLKVHSRSFDISPGKAVKQMFLNQPMVTEVGKAIQPAIQVALMDAHDNIVRWNGRTVDLEVYADSSKKKILQSVSAELKNGIATFDNLSLDMTGQNLVLGAISWTIESAYSNRFNVIEGGKQDNNPQY